MSLVIHACVQNADDENPVWLQRIENYVTLTSLTQVRSGAPGQSSPQTRIVRDAPKTAIKPSHVKFGAFKPEPLN